MKIVQLLPELNEGGVERGTMELSRELVKLGHKSIVISSGGKLVSQIEADGAEHITLDICSKNSFTAPLRMLRLRKILRELKPDILHARSRVPAWLTYWANKKLGLPFVTTVHGFNSVSTYSAIMTKGDRVICVSSAVESYIKKHYDVDKDKIEVIPRGVDLDIFNPNNIDIKFIDEFKERYELEDRYIVTSVGRITQLKDLETFIDAISLVKNRIPNVLGLIVGGVREDKEGYFNLLKEKIEKLNLQKYITFTGSQSRVEQIYALSDVVVSSSKKPESFGRSVAEAIAMNRPVIATNHGGVLDIVIDGKNGYFYSVGSSKELSQKIEDAKNLRFDGYSYIENNFSLNNMIEKTLEVYNMEVC